MTCCMYCKTVPGAPDWMARSLTLWSNQHGYKVRIFCNECGAWTDYTCLYAGEDKWTSVKPPRIGEAARKLIIVSET